MQANCTDTPSGRTRWVVPGVVLALALSACGGGGGSTDVAQAGASPTETTPVEADGEQIPIGALVPLTGGGSEFGPRMVTAMEIAIDEVNESPPMGRPFRLTVEDSQTDPDAGVRGAQKLIDVNEVEAVLGTWASAVTLAVAPLAIDAGVIQMNTSGAGDITNLDDDDLVWRFQPPATLTASALVQAALNEGWGTAAILARNDPANTGTADAFTEQFEAAGGEVVTSIIYNPEQTTYASEVNEVLESGADVILHQTYAPEMGVVLREAAQTGVDANWMAPAWAVNASMINAVGNEIAEGTYAVDSVPALGADAYDRLRAEFESRSGEPLRDSDTYVYMAYDMVVSLALAMEACQCTEGRDVAPFVRQVTGPEGTPVSSYQEALDALANGDEIDYDGASGVLNFDEFGDPQPRFGLYSVRNGEVTLESDFELER